MAELSLVIGVGYLIGRLVGWPYTLAASWLVILAAPTYLQSASTSIVATCLLTLGALCAAQVGSIAGMLDRDLAAESRRSFPRSFTGRPREPSLRGILPSSAIRVTGARHATVPTVKSIDAPAGDLQTRAYSAGEI